MPKLLSNWFSWLYILSALGCTSEEGSSSETTLNRGLNGDPETLHPHYQQSNQSSQVIRDIYEGLLVDDGMGTLQGGIAETFAVSSDGLTYKFKLRSNARWSDGSPILGSDIVRSFRCLADPNAASTNSSIISSVMNAREIMKGNIDVELLGISAPSDRYVQFRMAHVNSVFPKLLAMPGAAVVHTRSKTGDVCGSDVEVTDRVFSGAYKVASRVVGSNIQLTKNSHYWDAEKTTIETVIYHVVDPDVEVIRFRANELDVTANVPITYFERAKSEFGSELKISPFLGVYYIGLDMANPKIGSDRNLRAALFHSIDRDAIVEKLLGRGELAARVWVHPMVSGYKSAGSPDQQQSINSDSSITPKNFQKSKQNGSKSLTLDLLYNSGGGHEKIMLAIQSMWSENLDISANLRKEEWKVFLANVRDGLGGELFRLSWTADYDDAMAFLEIFESGHGQNLINYQNDRFDNLLNRARRELSIAKRNLLLMEAEQVLLADYAVIPIYFYVAKHLVSGRVGGWTDNPMDIHRTKDLRIIGTN